MKIFLLDQKQFGTYYFNILKAKISNNGDIWKNISVSQITDITSSVSELSESNVLKEVIYIGQPLSDIFYETLYKALLLKNYRLINTVDEYLHVRSAICTLDLIKPYAPESIYCEFEYEKTEEDYTTTINDLYNNTIKTFGNIPIIVQNSTTNSILKNFTHYYNTSFIAHPILKNQFIEICNNIRLNNDNDSEGLIVKKFIPTQENYRLLFFHHRLVKICTCDYGFKAVALKVPEYIYEIATIIPSSFFCNGYW